MGGKNNFIICICEKLFWGPKFFFNHIAVIKFFYKNNFTKKKKKDYNMTTDTKKPKELQQKGRDNE